MSWESLAGLAVAKRKYGLGQPDQGKKDKRPRHQQGQTKIDRKEQGCAEARAAGESMDGGQPLQGKSDAECCRENGREEAGQAPGKGGDEGHGENRGEDARQAQEAG